MSLVIIISLISLLLSASPSFCYLDSRDLAAAIDASIVRVLADGTFVNLQLNQSLPFQLVASLSCLPQPDHFPYPANPTGALADVLNTGNITLSGIVYKALPDGDYTVNPPTGFWPQYAAAVIGRLAANYNTHININRVFFPSSSLALEALTAGLAHMSDLYFVTGTFTTLGLPRSYSFIPSCSTAGYASNFLTLPSQNIVSVSQLHTGLEAGTITPNVVTALSTGDFQAVQPVLPITTTVIVVATIDAMVSLLQNGNASAAILSGVPAPSYKLTVFKTTVINPRGAMYAPVLLNNPIGTTICKDAAPNAPQARKPNLMNFEEEQDFTLNAAPTNPPFQPFTSPFNFSDLAIAVNTAIVKLINKDILVTLQTNNAPFHGVACLTCTPTNSYYTYPKLNVSTGLLPTVVSTGILKIAGTTSNLFSPKEGDYTSLTSPTGFFPDLARAVANELSIAYGRTIVPQWTLYNNASDALLSVSEGINAMTDFYFEVGGEFLSHQSVRNYFTSACSPIGYSPVLITKSVYNISHISHLTYLLQNNMVPASIGIVKGYLVEKLNSVLPSSIVFTSIVTATNLIDLMNLVNNGTVSAALWSIPETINTASVQTQINFPINQLSFLESIVVSPRVAFFRPPVFSLCNNQQPATPSPTVAPTPSPASSSTGMNGPVNGAFQLQTSSLLVLLSTLVIVACSSIRLFD